MGILLLTVKQERCSDLLLWSAAWLLLPLRLMPMPMPTMATAMALATLVLATLVLATPVLDMLVSATPVLVSMVLATTVLLTARGRLRPSLRLMPSTDTEFTPTPLLMDTLPLPSPLLPSLPLLLPSPPPPLLPQPSLPLLLLLLPPLPRLPLTLLLPLLLPPTLSPLPSATPVLDTLVSAMPVLDTTVLLTARGRLRPSLRLMPSTDTELTPTPDTVMLVSATLPPTATATVWEPTELSELITVKLVQLSSRSSTQSLLSVLLS